jgi:surface antigen Omp85-like protein
MFVKAAARLLTFLLLAAAAEAQDTRAAQLQRERANKATRLKPYEPSRLEAFVLQAEEGRLRRLISPHNGFFVEYGYTYKPVGSGLALGGGWRHDLFDRRARLVLEAGGSLRKYELLRADFSLPRLADDHLELGVEATYRRQPQDDFYGLGPDTRKDMRVNYLFKGREVEARAIVGPRPWLQLGTRAGWLDPSVGPGTDSRYPSIEALFDDGAAPGLVAQPEYRYGEAFAAVDYRDEPGNARAGGYYTLAWRQYSDQDLGRYSFRLLDAHARQFLPIFDKKRVFALQAQLVSTSPDDGQEVPFFLQPTLGGGHTLRSVADYRFRDRSLLGFNVEYRWEAFSALDMALFTDFGTVAPRVSDLDFGDMKRAYGIGFRFNTPGAVFLRVDIATGAGEGIRYFFKFSNVF